MVKFDSADCDLAEWVYQRFGQRWSQRFKLRQDTISAALFWSLKGWDWDKVRSTLLECLWYTDLPFGHTFTGHFGNLSNWNTISEWLSTAVLRHRAAPTTTTPQHSLMQKYPGCPLVSLSCTSSRWRSASGLAFTIFPWARKHHSNISSQKIEANNRRQADVWLASLSIGNLLVTSFVAQQW